MFLFPFYLPLKKIKIKKPAAEGQATPHAAVRHQTWRDFKTEMIVAAMVFCLIGGKVGGASFFPFTNLILDGCHLRRMTNLA